MPFAHSASIPVKIGSELSEKERDGKIGELQIELCRFRLKRKLKQDRTLCFFVINMNR